MSPATRAITTTLALLAIAAPAALAAPSALANDLRTPDARDAAATQAQRRSDIFNGGLRAPDWLSPDAEDAATAVTTSAPDPRTPHAPTVVEINSAQGFDWASAGIGAGAIALVVIALAGAVAVTGRSRPTPH
jgi:hypothetical protein